MRPVFFPALLALGLLLSACDSAPGNTSAIKPAPGTPSPADTTAPSLSLSVTPPLLLGGGKATLTAAATDNVGVTKVSFYEGTVLLGTLTATPYTLSLTLAAVSVPTTHTYTAVASDAAGNTRTALARVTVLPAALAMPALEVRFGRGLGGSTLADAQAVGRTVSLYAPLPTGPGAALLSSGKVSSDYKLTLPDPPAERLGGMLRPIPDSLPNCHGSYQLGDPALQVVPETFFRVDMTGLPVTGLPVNGLPINGLAASGEGRLIPLNPDGSVPEPDSAAPSGYPNSLWYADRASTVTGTLTCAVAGGSTIRKADLTLSKGWNVVQQTSYTQGTTSTVELRSVPASALVLVPAGPN